MTAQGVLSGHETVKGNRVCAPLIMCDYTNCGSIQFPTSCTKIDIVLQLLFMKEEILICTVPQSYALLCKLDNPIVLFLHYL